MSTNADDLNKARQLIRQGWESVAAEYAKDRTGIFGRSAVRLLELLRPPPGSALLDVGTGSGAFALQAAAQVGPDGQVVGTDIATSMLSLATQAAAEQRAANTTFRQMDAEQLNFPDDAFDIVACALSLFQFPDMKRALAEMRRVLKPGGRLGLSNWGPGYFSPIALRQRDLFREFGIKPLLANPIVFKPAKLEALLQEAGFIAVKLIEETDEVWFESAEEAWAFDLDMGPFPVMLQQQLSAERQKDLARQFTAVLEDLITEQGIGCTFHLLYAIAEKGDAD